MPTEVLPEAVSNKKPWIETAKFIVRMVILVFGPQLLALATAHTGIWWANILSLILPVVDKWVHESPDIKATGIIPI